MAVIITQRKLFQVYTQDVIKMSVYDATIVSQMVRNVLTSFNGKVQNEKVKMETFPIPPPAHQPLF